MTDRISQQWFRMPYDKNVGKERSKLYAAAISRINQAVKEGYFIEAIALSESVLSDRLLARYSYLKGFKTESRAEKTLHKLLKSLIDEDHSPDRDRMIQIYQDIFSWKEVRNSAVHAMVKLREGGVMETFESKYKQLHPHAQKGIVLVRALLDADRKSRYEVVKQANELAEKPA
jgi:hypothetical protein